MKKEMKKILFILFALMCFNVYADPDEIILNNNGSGHNRSESPTLTDMPRAYYDSDIPEIIIDGGGAVSYYEVEITSAINGYYELYTLVNGTYDTFDVLSLSAGTHTITITSPLGNVYKGTFTVN